MESKNAAPTQKPATTETQCLRLGHCREHQPCCFCAEEERVMTEFLALERKAA